MENTNQLENADNCIKFFANGSALKHFWLTNAAMNYLKANMPQHAHACELAICELGQARQAVVMDKIANIAKSIHPQMPRMTNDKIAVFNVYQRPSEK